MSHAHQCLRLAGMLLAFIWEPSLSAWAAEKLPDLKQVLADMAEQGRRYDPKALHGQGVPVLAALLDHLLPETAPAVKDSERMVRNLIEQLGDDDFKVREQATTQLIAIGRRHRQLVEKATTHKDLEVLRRAQGVIAAWTPPRPEDHNRYREGLFTYLRDIKDADRLDLLGERAALALQQGMPDELRLELLRLMLAGVARHGQDLQWDRLIPLLRHKDPQVGVLVVSVVGGCPGITDAFPRLLVDALDCGREPIMDAAISWAPSCRDRRHSAEVRERLRKIFKTGSEKLKFHACFPLMYSYRDSEAYNYLLKQTQSGDPMRARTATYWVGDSCNFGKVATPALLEKLVPLLQSRDVELRRAAAYALGNYQGEKVVENLIPVLADPVEIIVTQASQGLLAQLDKKMLLRLLEDTAQRHSNEQVRARAKRLLGKIGKS